MREIFTEIFENQPLDPTEAARRGAIVSYDLNYRASLWKSIGGKSKAQEVNRRLAPYVDTGLSTRIFSIDWKFYSNLSSKWLINSFHRCLLS